MRSLPLLLPEEAPAYIKLSLWLNGWLLFHNPKESGIAWDMGGFAQGMQDTIVATWTSRTLWPSQLSSAMNGEDSVRPDLSGRSKPREVNNVEELCHLDQTDCWDDNNTMARQCQSLRNRYVWNAYKSPIMNTSKSPNYWCSTDHSQWYTKFRISIITLVPLLAT